MRGPGLKCHWSACLHFPPSHLSHLLGQPLNSHINKILHYNSILVTYIVFFAWPRASTKSENTGFPPFPLCAHHLKPCSHYDSFLRILIPLGMSPPVYSIAHSWILETQHWFYHLFLSFLILELMQRLSVFILSLFPLPIRVALKFAPCRHCSCPPHTIMLAITPTAAACYKHTTI